MQLFNENIFATRRGFFSDLAIEDALLERVLSIIPKGSPCGTVPLQELLSTANANEVVSDLISAPSVGPQVERLVGVPCRIAEITLLRHGDEGSSDVIMDHPYSELQADGWDASLKSRLMSSPMHAGVVIGLSDEYPVRFTYEEEDGADFTTREVEKGGGVLWTGPLARFPLGGKIGPVSGMYLSFNPVFVHRSTALLQSIPPELQSVYGGEARRLLGIGDRYPKIYPISAQRENQVESHV